MRSPVRILQSEEAEKPSLRGGFALMASRVGESRAVLAGNSRCEF
jgi:hypothetical protein